MSRMTKRMRDQLNDIALARTGQKKTKLGYTKAQLAAVAAVTARLEEGLRPQPDPGDFTSFFTQMVRSQLHSQMNRLYADITKRNADLLAQTRMYSVRVPVAGYDLAVDPLDDIQKDCMSRADDMVDALKYATFQTVAVRRPDFGVIQCSDTI